MNVLLVNPTTVLGEVVVKSGRCQVKVNPGMGIWPPLDLAEIAASIRGKTDSVQILDFSITKEPFECMINRIAQFKPNILILENTTPTLIDDLIIAKSVRKLLPEVKNVFFGQHATVRPEDILCEDVPYVIRGEPDLTSQDLIDFFKKEKEIYRIPGLSYFLEGKVFHNKAREPIENLDSLPFPARDLLRNERYILPTLQEPFTILRTSRGCTHKCIFCTSTVYYGNGCRWRSAESIIEEIKEVINRYAISNFVFISDTFNIRERFVFDLCDLIQKEKLKIRWACNSRVDTFTEDMGRIMKESGCWLVSFGVESGSDEILRNSKKGISVEQSKKAIEINKKFGIKSLCYFIFGLPGETEETIDRTIAFSKQADPDYVHFYTATPFPGTKFYEMAEENGWLTSRDWKRFFHGASDVIAYPNLPSCKIRNAVRKGYRFFYLQPHVIYRELKFISSNKQLKGFLATGFDMLRRLI